MILTKKAFHVNLFSDSKLGGQTIVPGSFTSFRIDTSGEKVVPRSLASLGIGTSSHTPVPR